MEIIRFVLSNFWVWLGAVILILAIGQAAVEVIKAVHPSRKISAYKIGDKIKIIQEEREEVRTITDIVCMHYLKTGAVQFLFELDNSGKLVSIAPAEEAFKQ